MTEYTAHGANPDHMYRRSETTNQDTWNISTTYDWKVDKNNAFKFLVGMNRVTYDEEYNWSRKGDLSDITNPQFDLAVGLQEASGGYDWEGQLGFFGRINYALRIDTYWRLISVMMQLPNFRITCNGDGSHLFQPDGVQVKKLSCSG